MNNQENQITEINGLPISHFYKLEDGVTYIEKTQEEKLKEGLITVEEYNKYIIQMREEEYKNKTDSQVLELMRNFLNKNKESLSEEDKLMLETINSNIADIKTNYIKA